jgi:hypothetical protein
MLNQLSRTLPQHQTTKNPLSFEAAAIILSLDAPDHDQDEQVPDVCPQGVHVAGVSIGHKVRCYGLISQRESNPPCAMFRVHYSSLNR